jgi:hypothetical protein
VADETVASKLLLPLAAQILMLGPEALVLDGAAGDDEEVIDLEGLLKIVERT